MHLPDIEGETQAMTHAYHDKFLRKLSNPNPSLQIPRLATATRRCKDCKDYRYHTDLVAPSHIVEVYSGTELYSKLKPAAFDTSRSGLECLQTYLSTYGAELRHLDEGKTLAARGVHAECY